MMLDDLGGGAVEAAARQAAEHHALLQHFARAVEMPASLGRAMAEAVHQMQRINEMSAGVPAFRLLLADLGIPRSIGEDLARLSRDPLSQHQSIERSAAALLAGVAPISDASAIARLAMENTADMRNALRVAIGPAYERDAIGSVIRDAVGILSNEPWKATVSGLTGSYAEMLRDIATARGMLPDPAVLAAAGSTAAAIGVDAADTGTKAPRADVAFAVFLLALVAEMRQRLPGLLLSSETYGNVVGTAALVLTLWQMMSQAGDTATVVALLEEPRARVQRPAVVQPIESTPPRRWRTRTSKVLRADPDDASGARLADLPAGVELVERDRVGRWLYVDVVNPASGTPASGWAFLRNLDPIRDEP